MWLKFLHILDSLITIFHYYLKRAALHKIFLDACINLGITIRYNSRVKDIKVPTEYDDDDDTPPSTPSTPGASSRATVTLSNGETVFGDLIIGADGHDSLAREFVKSSHVRSGKMTRRRGDTITPKLFYGNGNSVRTNGNINGFSSYQSSQPEYDGTSDDSEDSNSPTFASSAYNVARLKHSRTIKNSRLIYSTLIPESSMLSDPDLKALWEYKGPTIWMGSERHAEGYPIVSFSHLFTVHILV